MGLIFPYIGSLVLITVYAVTPAGTLPAPRWWKAFIEALQPVIRILCILGRTVRNVGSVLRDALVRTTEVVVGLMVVLACLCGAGLGLCLVLMIMEKAADVAASGPAKYREWRQTEWVQDCAKYSELSACNRRYFELQRRK